MCVCVCVCVCVCTVYLVAMGDGLVTEGTGDLTILACWHMSTCCQKTTF